MKLRDVLCCAGFFLVALLPVRTLGATPPLQKVVFIFGGFNERTGVLFVAKDMRFFEEQGLDAQVVQVRSGPVGVAAMAANEAHFYLSSATGSTLGAMASGLDLVFVAGIVNTLDGDFVVAPKIRTPSDLRGKVLGVQSIGGGIWTFTMLALDYWGLVPERDKIQFRILGDQSVIAQGVLTGTVDGAYLGYTFSKAVQRQGFRVLADLAKLGIPYQGIGVVTRRAFLEKSPEVVERTLRALAKSIAFFKDPANRETVVRILARWLRLARLEDAEAGYESIRPLYDRRIFPTTEGLRNALRVLSRVDPKYGRLKAEELTSDRIVRKLEQEGLFK